MALGKGLESLIPKKKTDDAVNNNIALNQGGEIASPALPANISNISASDVVKKPEQFVNTSQRNINQYQQHSHQKQSHESVFHIEVEKIKPNPYQPRREFNEENLKELAQSIREFGIIQPIIVSKIIKETETGTVVEYQLVAGERRLKAAKMVGLERIPAIIRKVDLGRTNLELALIENIQRSDLNPLETARAYSRLQDEFGLTQREVAVKVGKSREAVANTLRLLNLPTHIQEALSKNIINESQARALLAITNQVEQEKAFQNLLTQKVSVRALKESVQVPIDPQKNYWEKQLEDKLGMPVKIIKNGARGKMVIQFFSEKEWQAILEKLLNGEIN